jgi:MFS family permease
MIFAGWSIYAAIYLLFAYATNATHAWTLFLIYGVYYALTEPVEKKLVADLGGIENKGLAYGWFNFAVGMGALPANLLFGWMYEQFGALTAFGFGAVMAAVATVLLALVRIQPASSGTTTDEYK